jgi:hypothetical protein
MEPFYLAPAPDSADKGIEIIVCGSPLKEPFAMNRFHRFIQAPAIAVFLFAISTTRAATAQEFYADNIEANARATVALDVNAMIKARVQRPRKHRWLTLNSVSVATLAAGEAVDSWGTHRNMTHTKWICGNSPAFAGGYDTNVPGEISSLRDVQMLCGAGPAGQSANWVFDATRAGYFTEGGWVTQLHLAGDRDYAAVEGWNLANDVVWYLVARHLGRRTNWVRKCGLALNFGRGFVHLYLGFDNIIAVSNHQNPNTLDLHVPKSSAYAAPRWWGRN